MDESSDPSEVGTHELKGFHTSRHSYNYIGVIEVSIHQHVQPFLSGPACSTTITSPSCVVHSMTIILCIALCDITMDSICLRPPGSKPSCRSCQCPALTLQRTESCSWAILTSCPVMTRDTTSFCTS
jgi:hypothetical protein